MNIFICSQSTKNFHLFGILVCSLLAPLSCIKARSDSSLKVIAGNEDNQSLPSTVKLEFPSQDNQVIENCTGAFVRDDLILTAAHCGVRFQGQVRITTIFNNSKIISSSDKPIIHPKYDAQIATETDMTKMTPYDLAFIKVPAGSAPTSAIAKLASSPAKKGDQVTILGYGFSDRAKTSKLGSRRIGSTTIGDIRDNGMLVTAGAWTGDGDQSLGSSIMQGDSGGALYNAQSKEIVGVVSANSNTSVNSFGISYFTNIATEDSRSFIQTVMGTAPSQQSDASIKVGGYSCQQQKD
ncbi:MAG: S1 family peptidase, partial [Proteobacteria bacterium]|nr:S1 family peptidase [Pseudomonadota bacterium]